MFALAARIQVALSQRLANTQTAFPGGRKTAPLLTRGIQETF